MKTKYRLICCAIVMIVLLRVGIGWQFLYEGVVKFDPAANFSADSLLGFAKGPPAEMFYWMLPDIDGVERLEIAEVESGRTNADGTPVLVNDVPERVPTFIVYENAWREFFKDYLVRYFPSVSAEGAEALVRMDFIRKTQLANWLQEKGLLTEEEAGIIAPLRMTVAAEVARISEWERPNREDSEALSEAKQIIRAVRIFGRYITSLRADASDEGEDVDAFIGSRERFIEHRSDIPNNASFEQERRWWQMMGYRGEAGYWTRKFDRVGNSMQSELGRVVDLQLAGRRGQIATAPERELIPSHHVLEQFGIQYTIPSSEPHLNLRSRMDVMNLGVKIFLTAIGLCLMLGFCTRLAALAGAAFLVNVVLVTWPVPGVYPPIPMVAGSVMVVSKDMVGLLAICVLVLVPAGRWGGLDYFLWNYGGKQIAGLFCPCSCCKEKITA